MGELKGGVVTLFGRIINAIVSFLGMAILGRILFPEDFGLFAIVLAIQSMVLPFVDSGLIFSYIKRESVNTEVSNSFYTINVIISFLSVIFMMAISFGVAAYYDEPTLQWLLIYIAPALFIMGLAMQPGAVLTKEKKFIQLTFISSGAIIFGIIVSVFCAWLGWGVWSLVAKVYTEVIVTYILTIFFSKNSCKVVRIKTLKKYIEDLKFGWSNVWSRVVGAIIISSDKLILGNFVSTSSLGGYSRAQQLAQMPNGMILSPLTSNILVYLHGVKEQKAKKIMVIIVFIVTLMAIPIVLIVTSGDVILPLILGERWGEFGYLLQLLGVYGVARVFENICYIYGINEKKVKRHVYAIYGGIVTIVIFPLATLLIDNNLAVFTAVLSIGNALYWVSVLYYNLVCDYGNDKKAIKNGFLKVISILLVPATLFFYFKQYLDFFTNVSTVQDVSTMLLIVTVLVIMVIGIVAKNETTQIYKKIKTHQNKKTDLNAKI